MPSQRTLKVNSLLHRELGALFARELEMPKGTLATITRVDAGADLKHATAFLRIYPPAHEKEVLEYIKHASAHIQHLLNRRLAMRFVPQIAYRIQKEEEVKKQDELFDAESILDTLAKEQEDDLQQTIDPL